MKEVRQMTFFEGISMMIGFGTLIVSILALSYSFTQKK
ncbi:putative holin-like toxin [Tetzosporium hominis]